jgi:molybdenum-dependent DNA-binding transcriptional regulator ModE
MLPRSRRSSRRVPDPWASAHRLFSWDRLQRFAAAAGHPSLRSAARTLGTRQTCLFKQVDRLERDLGGQLLIRTPTRHHPMQLTALGTEVVAAVRKRQKANGIDANPAGGTATQQKMASNTLSLSASRI